MKLSTLRFVIPSIACVLIYSAIMQPALAAPKKSAKAPVSEAVELICPAGDAKAKDAKRRAKLRKMLQDIARGSNINAVDKNGQTALMYAAALDERLAICWLVAKGADVTLKSTSGKTAQEFTRNDYSWDLINVCEKEKEPLTSDELRESNTRPSAWGYALDTSTSPSGSRLPRVAAFIKRGLDLTGEDSGNAQKMEKRPILEQYYCTKEWYGPVTMRPSAECAALLLRHGYDAQGIKFCRHTSVDMVRLLLALGVKVNEQDADTRLWAAIAVGDLPAVKKLLPAGKKPEPAPEYVENSPTAEMARFFLSHGYTDASSVDTSRLPYADEILDDLLKAGLNADAAMKSAATTGRADLVHPLLKAGADPTEGLKKVIESKPHHSAEIVDILIKAGADVKGNVEGLMKQALNWCYAEDLQEHVKVLKALITAGGQVPKDALSLLNNIKTLKKNLSEVEMEARLAGTLALAEVLLQNGADVNGCDETTPLMLMAKKQEKYYAGVIDWLCKHGADVNRANGYGVTALSFARTPESISALIRAGADVNACDHDGNTAAMNIITEIRNMSGEHKAELIKRLMAAGAKTDIRNKQGKTVLDLAKDAKLHEVITLLEKKA